MDTCKSLEGNQVAHAPSYQPSSPLLAHPFSRATEALLTPAYTKHVIAAMYVSLFSIEVNQSATRNGYHVDQPTPLASRASAT